MKHISFQNEGLIDLRAVKTFGVSSKESDTAIGFFGTGLKYAIAIALRLGCKITLYRGMDKYEFIKKSLTVRVDDFDIVCMGEEELAFTTELGKTWEAWQAFRELWCNALDEGGMLRPEALPPAEGKTTIVVSGEAFVNAYYEREKIMLTGEARWISDGVELSMKKSDAMYYRGIRVSDLQQPAVLTYNIVGRPISLTEDRTMKYSYLAPACARDAIVQSDSEELLELVLNAPEGSFEANINFYDSDPGPLILKMLGEERFRNINNPSLLRMYAVAKGSVLRPSGAELCSNEQQQLSRALEFLANLGYVGVGDWPLHVTDDLPDGRLGQAYEGAIYISRRCFMQGTKMVAGTIFEEWVHLSCGLYDETRELQNYLVDAVMTMGEKYVGEPL